MAGALSLGKTHPRGEGAGTEGKRTAVALLWRSQETTQK